MTHTNTYRPDLICLSHLRWNFVFQRPQHLMSRFARDGRVFFVEEVAPASGAHAELKTHTCLKTGVEVVTPHLPEDARPNSSSVISDLLSEYFKQKDVSKPIVWFYTPMAFDCLPHDLSPSLVVYDCMDELSLFRNAPPELQANERRLLHVADLVFTGGVSLFEHKRGHHPHVYAFPSGVDVEHFAKARVLKARQERNRVAGPAIGICGGY